jgi:hypothetical protein
MAAFGAPARRTTGLPNLRLDFTPRSPPGQAAVISTEHDSDA